MTTNHLTAMNSNDEVIVNTTASTDCTDGFFDTHEYTHNSSDTPTTLWMQKSLKAHQTQMWAVFGFRQLIHVLGAFAVAAVFLCDVILPVFRKLFQAWSPSKA